MSRSYGKNRWALFLLILLGIVVGSFIGHLAKNVDFLSWLDYGLEFSIGYANGSNVVTINLGALIIHFGIRLKITIASVICAIVSVIIYKRL